MNLIYRATRDGGMARIYHQMVYKDKPLLMMIQTNRHGTIGVYTSTA